LYDLEKDPAERRNLAKEQAAVTRRLSTKLLAWRRSLPAPKTTS
jgi:hypothetical protein